jgi:acetyltransferase-like isoleucine patch superfamily enzyme
MGMEFYFMVRRYFIRDNSVIKAHSVVTKNIDSYSFYAVNLGRLVKRIEQ